MKKNSKLLILFVAILVIVFAVVYLYHNHDFENSFTKAENDWIKENTNKVIDIEV